MKTTISVIIPAYRPHSFNYLLQSIHDNHSPHVEWIVVDDGSGLDYAQIFDDLPSHVRVIRGETNRGPAAARNIGISQATGVWIKFLDADDRIDAGHLEILLRAANSLNGCAVPFARTMHLYPNGRAHLNNSGRELPTDYNKQFIMLLTRPFLNHCGALFPRKLLLELGGYDETLSTDEDGDLLLRITCSGHYFVPVDGAFYLYTHHSRTGRVSANDSISKLHSRIRTCDKVVESFAKGLPADVARAVAQRIDSIAVAFLQHFPNEAQELFQRAEALSPGYRPALRPTLLLLRWIGGPAAVNKVKKLIRVVRPPRFGE